ncbi:MAG: hypothetical protein JO216_05795 [Hyphomicrobiales bacterium]|nr:hypothetical protein [Hyphomicrobiales bacterium]
MNTIVRNHYPVAKLPKDLQEGLDPTAAVCVTITPEPSQPETSSVETSARQKKSRALEIIEGYQATYPPRFRDVQEILDHVRRVRDGGAL